ncbi:HAMP domain-containing sensor histidine kinase [Pseudonocardia sp. MH-G8]|uniref:sensor histidine kinase n=1 Tax=Pseudonocardia sp. MH-G8 TaxID=1854588 RepID=UPI000B9FC159|nr:ATP-binding protein [Pseudonocardia sp. MH-G8]OZM80502.1 two-component sensor histidine kinase [Pseudonocardia sp. MH-G8]
MPPAPGRPTGTVRLRITVLYTGLFLTTGILLVVLVYVLAAHAPLPEIPPAPSPPPAPPAPDGSGAIPQPPAPPPTAAVPEGRIGGQRTIDVQRLLVSSVLALAVMGVASLALGWLVAGRVLRPLATMTATVRRISADDLDRRLAATGPDDELKELADTFDGLLDRLERAFTAQRRFVADASHELRTPLTLQRTTIEVALGDPGATSGSLRDTLRRLLASGEHQNRIIEALLTLARSQQGLDHREEVDLAAVTRTALDADRESPAIRIDAALAPATVAGDPELLARLVVNLLSNAERHNVPGGWVRVSTSSGRDRVVLTVTNSGPAVPPGRAADLLEPFRRLGPARTGDRGLGLGLSIVAAITRAHGGAIDLHPRREGGLQVRVTLPSSAAG